MPPFGFGARRSGTRIFYASDVHGSERTWRKFLNAAKFYDADVLIMGGDMTGKAVVPIAKQADGSWKCIVDMFNSDLPQAPAPAKMSGRR